MADYDFTGLSPSDFEALCHDLLGRSLAVPLQAFTTGRDKGIDLRHASVEGEDWIVQCKHFARSGYAKLRSHLMKKELPKIKKLRPKRYILVTSVGLSPSNVDELYDLLTPYCKSQHDIIGRDDVNALLRTNPRIEQAHFKLWLTSEAVLSRVLHNDVFVQSLLTEEQIKRRLGLYVYTDSFEDARHKLDSERVCILSGVPGVGKTTLAEMLLVEFLRKDWQVVTIHQNVAEGQKLFSADEKAKQVFYYDDFLGQISTGEKLGKNEDRALLQLIGAVCQTANKRFILTTREYILAQAKAEHEHLARSEIDLYQFVVSCEDYSDVDKARILANHLYFSQVPQEHVAALIQGRTYEEIISHRNYNPRIIEGMTQVTETSACRPTQYPSMFLDRLDNPSALWTHAFENQISEASRHLLLTLGSCGDGILLLDLQEAFEAFYLGRGKQYGFSASPSSFTKALDELEGNFVRIDRNSSQLIVACHNPSILDFLNEWLRHHPDDATDILRYAVFFEQVERLFKVFQFGSAGREGNKRYAFNVEIVDQAIDRTLSARSVRLTNTGKRINKWFRHPVSVWERLRLCCHIGTSICDSQFRKAVQDRIDAHLAEVDRHPGELLELLSLFDVINDSKWLDKNVVDLWSHAMWGALLTLVSNFEEPLEVLSAAAQWFVGNRNKFEHQQIEAFEENLANAVCHEVEYNSESSDSERLGGDLETVEEIARTLGREFSDEIRWLNEALAECGSMDRDDGGAWGGHRSRSCASSIESLFDALLE